MTTQLHVEPRTPPLTWKEFRETKPPKSLALDGFVADAPKFDPEGPWFCFNHHEQVDRLTTRATCGQILMAIKQGLFDCLDATPGPIHVYVNDCDEDVCMSWFLLRHDGLTEKNSYMKLTRLVQVVDTLDSTAGAYPYPKDFPLLGYLSWIFEPYRALRISGKLDLKQEEDFVSVIEQVEERIILYLTGQGEQIELDTRYEVLEKFPEWILVKETGPHSKTGMFADGIKAYVAVRNRPNGNLTCTLGRLSPFITKFNIPKMFRKLNAAETKKLQKTNSLDPGRSDWWGGGNTIGGSPRVNGTVLSVEEIAKIVNSVIEREK